MSEIDLSKTLYNSIFSGLGNVPGTTLTKSIPAETVGLSPTIITASVPLGQTNLISQVEVQFTGLDDNWYIFKGHLENFYTSNNIWTNDIVNTAYAIDLDTGYDDDNFVLTISLYNLTLNDTVGTPAFTVNCNISLYEAPFS